MRICLKLHIQTHCFAFSLLYWIAALCIRSLMSFKCKEICFMYFLCTSSLFLFIKCISAYGSAKTLMEWPSVALAYAIIRERLDLANLSVSDWSLNFMQSRDMFCYLEGAEKSQIGSVEQILNIELTGMQCSYEIQNQQTCFHCGFNRKSYFYTEK